jgi:hypothetical protein
MRIIFNNYFSHSELIKTIKEWATQYSITNYIVDHGTYKCIVRFSDPGHFTVFALTWIDFISDIQGYYRYQLERYVFDTPTIPYEN